MEPPYGVMMCEGYNALRQALLKPMQLQPLDEMALALFVSVAVHIKSHKEKMSFAAQLGEKLNGSTPCVSGLLIQAVKMRGTDGINVLSLADGIFLWMEEWQRRENHQPEPRNPFERNRTRWANEYLTTSRGK